MTLSHPNRPLSGETSTNFAATPRGVQLSGAEVPSLAADYRFSESLLRFDPEVAELLTVHYPTPWAINGTRWCNDSRWHMQHHRQLIDVGVETAGHQLVGFGRVAIWPNGGNITDLVVHTEHRRRGIGTAITLAQFRLARKAGVERMFVELERASNRRSVYESLGFREVDDDHMVYEANPWGPTTIWTDDPTAVEP